MFIPNDKLDAVFKLIKKDALNKHSKVLILVSTDCDSICAGLILVSLFQQEYISYILKPVSSYEALFETKELLADGEVISLVLINCGGSVDILQFLQLSTTNITVYICDSHLPYAA